MPEKKPEGKSGKPSEHKPATNHGLEEYEELFRRTDNPYRRINPHWPNWQNGDNKNKS